MAAPRTASLFGFLTPLFRTVRPTTHTTSPIAQNAIHANPFSTTPITNAKGGTMNPKNRVGKKLKDMRITLLRYHMQHPKTPRPLRFSRMRGLRHWTIHRAWMLFRRGKMAEDELELQRMYKSMHNAMEELGTISSPDGKDVGRLYRIANEKKGVYGPNGVPIEYARAQVETPAREAWDHSWTR